MASPVRLSGQDVMRLSMRTLATAVLLGPCLFPLDAAPELVVARDHTPVLLECGDASSPVGLLDQGQTVRLRFALAGTDSRCYSIAAEVDGRSVTGYVSRDALIGIEELERERRDASVGQVVRGGVDAIRLSQPRDRPFPDSPEPAAGPEALRAAAALEAGNPQEVPGILDSAAVEDGDRLVAALRAKAYLQLTRPAEALAALEPALARRPNDAALLGLAGMAAFQGDRLDQAERYLARSLELEPNPGLESTYRRVQREAAADESADKAVGSRFNLRYEGDALPDDVARELVREFDAEIKRVSSRLGCPFDERLNVIVQTAETFRKATGAADWSGGRYDGRIHIALAPDGVVDEEVRATFSHEFVHACLSRKGRWPAWLHEGLAQRHSGRRLGAESRAALTELNRERGLPSLRRLGAGWGALDGREAAVAYALALAAADLLYEDLKDYGVRNLLNNPARLETVTQRLDERLREVFQ